MATKKLTAKPVATKKATIVTAAQKVRAHKGQKVTEAPVVNDVHAPKPDAVPLARKRLAKDNQKAAHQALVDDLVAGRKAISPLTVSDLTTADVALIAKAKGWPGYSGLTAAEGRQFLVNGGKKPAPTAGTTRALRETVAAAKKAGLVQGPVSALKVAELKKVAAQLEAGEKVGTITKPAPNVGTADWHKNLIRNASGKGFTAEAVAECKKRFGEKASISTLKAEQLRALTLALGLSNGQASR